jgi:hypothetical protein
MVETSGPSPSSTESFMDVPTPTEVDDLGRPIATTVDEDDSQAGQGGTQERDPESDLDEGSLGTEDIEGISKFGNAGQVLFATKNRTMLCGHDRATCTRQKHRVGYYLATPNTSGAVLDAIEDTHISIDNVELQKEENCHLLEQVGISSQKQEAEAAYKAKSPPVVQIDSTPTIFEEPSPRARREQLNEWLNALPATPQDSSTLPPSRAPQAVKPTKPTLPNPVPTEQVAQESPSIIALLGQVVNKFDSMQTTQQALADALVQREANCVQPKGCKQATDVANPRVALPPTRTGCTCKCTDCNCNDWMTNDEGTVRLTVGYAEAWSGWLAVTSIYPV